MARDIEEFLRRAAERRKQNQQGGGQRPPTPPPPQPPRREPPRQPPKTSRPLPSLTISEDDIVEEVEVVQDSRLRSSIRVESVNRQVREHLDTRDVTEHASHLAEGIESADDRLESRLKSTFDHEVGHLDHDTVTDDVPSEIFGASQRTDVAAELVDMLRSPGGIRLGIMVNEILNRPDFDRFEEDLDE